MHLKFIEQNVSTSQILNSFSQQSLIVHESALMPHESQRRRQRTCPAKTVF